VHLTDYPQPEDDARDPALDDAMEAARAIVGLGRQVRTDARVRVRQPLAEALVHVSGDPAGLRPLLDEVREELNVKEVVFAGSASEVAGWRAKPDFKVLGPRLGPQVKAVAAALGRDDGSLAARLAAGESVVLATGEGEVTLAPGEVDLIQQTQTGWGVASNGPVTVALELEVTAELRREGVAREVVRAVQDARRAAALDVGDRIVLGVAASGEVDEAVRAFSEVVAAETLAVELILGEVDEPLLRQPVDVQDTPVTLTLRRA